MILSKLLTIGQVGAIIERGETLLVGYVTREQDILEATDPQTLLQWHGLTDRADYTDEAGNVYCLRFPHEPLHQLVNPTERTGSRYPLGFIPATSAIVPVWWLEPTRTPIGTILWRFSPGEQPAAIAVYRSLGVGWQGSRGYTIPRSFEGPRAQWAGQDVLAAPLEQSVEVMSRVELPGLVQASTGMWHIQAEGVAVIEVLLRAVYRDVPVRILESREGQALVVSTDPAHADAAAAAGLTEVEPEVWQAVVAVDELRERSGIERQAPATT